MCDVQNGGIITMRKKKGNPLRRMMALLLSIVLSAGMVLDTASLTVLAMENTGEGYYTPAQESVSGNTVTEEETGAESDGKETGTETDGKETGNEGTGADSAADNPGDAGETDKTGESADNPETEESDGGSEQEPAAPTEEGEGETISGNGVEQGEMAAPRQKALQAEGIAAQADGKSASGTGWVLGSAGTLTISSDAGMANWYSEASKYKSDVKAVVIKDGVTSIEASGFSQYINLTSITIPDSVTSIGAFAFYGCSSLTGSITIPDGVTSIEQSTFWGCSSLTSIEIPSGVTSIGDYAFDFCSSLTSIEIPSGVTYIGTRAFDGCSSLTGSITIPSGVTSIKQETFQGCSSLISIEIPSGVTSIEDLAFSSCTALERVTMQSIEPPTLKGKYTNSTFYRSYFVEHGKKGIKVPEGRVTAYKEAWPDWSDYIAPDGTLEEKIAAAKEAVDAVLEEITLSNDTTAESLRGEIEKAVDAALDKAGMDSEGITVSVTDFTKTDATKDAAGSISATVTITGGEGPDTVSETITVDKVIARPLEPAEKAEAVKKALEDAISAALEGKVTKENLDEMGEKFTLDAAKVLEEAGISGVETGDMQIVVKHADPDGEDSITVTVPFTIEGAGGDGEKAVVTIPVTVGSGTDWILDGNGKLTIRSDDGMSDWCSKRSEYASYVKEAVIQDGVTNIGYKAFFECSSLTGIEIPDSVTSIGDYAFNKCSSLTSIEIPSGVTSIGDYAFSGCSSLTGIEIPSGVTSIEFAVFRGCSSLTGIEIPSGITSIEGSAFNKCSSLTAITIPDSVTSIGGYAFSGCAALESVTMQKTEPPALEENTTKSTVFNGCYFVEHGKKGIKVPAGTVNAYKEAWPDWSGYIVTASTPEEKVAAAKEAAEAALKDMTAFNATTAESLKEVIEKAVQAALDKADVDSEGITVSVTDFTKEEATEDAAGSISATVTITSGEGSDTVSDTITVDKIIAELLTPAEKVEAVKTALEDAISDALAGKVTKENLDEMGETFTLDAAKALEEAGIPADGVKIGDLQTVVKHADPDGEDSITVTIPFTVEGDGGGTDKAVATIPVSVASGNGWMLDVNGKLTIKSDAGMAEWKEKKLPYITQVKSAVIEDSVTGIAEDAFRNCENLTEITIPGSVTGIGASAFASCESLTEIIIPGSVKSIETSAFASCKSLKAITIPDGVTTIAWAAFFGCSSLTEITIPSSVTGIEHDAFRSCYRLAEITIPDGVTGIGYRAFESCIALTEITIPSSVESIGYSAFASCTALESVIMQGSTPPELSTNNRGQQFYRCKFETEDKKAIKVPVDAVDTYKKAKSWSDYTRYIIGDSTPAQRVEEAKGAAGSALDDFTVPENADDAAVEEAVKAAIEEAVKKALDDAGMESEGVDITLSDFTYEPAAKGKDGQISAAVTVTIDGESGTIDVDKKIPGLPYTDEEKAEAAKKAAEDALKEITVSNGTTQESLQDAIEKAVQDALEAAGIDSTDESIR